MTKSVELNTIAIEHLFNAFSHMLCDVFEERFMKNLPMLSAPATANTTVEKPITRRQIKNDYGVSVPTLKKMVESGAVTELKVDGLRGFRYLPSEFNKAYKPVKR